MVASDSVLQRYALAYIKKSGGNSDVKKFLRYFNNTRNLTWDEDTFAEAYKEHTRLNSTNRRNIQKAEMINITQRITGNLQALRLHIYMYTIIEV